jgi:hypothetical protein
MKRTSFFILVIILSLKVSGQESKSIVGLEYRPSYTSLRMTNQNIYGYTETFRPVITFSAAFFFQYNFSEHFSLKPNFGFEVKGADYGFAGYEDFYSDKIRLGEIMVSLLARATFGKKVAFFVNGGPYSGILFQSYDAGISSGIGVLFSTKKSLAITVEVRNNLGLSDVDNALMGVGSLQGSNIKTRSTNLLIGLAFNLGKKTAG